MPVGIKTANATVLTQRFGYVTSSDSVAAGGSILSANPDLHLLRRATFGPTPALEAELASRGRAGWLDDQLHPERIADSAMDSLMLDFPLVNKELKALRALLDPRLAATQLVQATLARQIWSKRQLFEVMVDFWSNHFNVFTPHVSTYTTKPIEDRTVIRRYALGRFEDLLLANTKSPAMLAYLDNEDSDKKEPNENYGRELLQLHTVTPEAGFSEADVLDSARILTGRSTDDDGNFQYKADDHWVGPVRIMGWSSSNASASGGLAAGDSYIRYLARHPNTATALAREIAARFVSDDPPASLIATLADVYLDSGTAIVPVLQALFASPEFGASVGQKTRRPTEDVVATMRILGMETPKGLMKPVGLLVGDCDNQGQSPLGEFEPVGYSDVSGGWRSAGGMLARWNLHRSMTRGYPKGIVRPALSTFLAGPPMATHGEMLDRLCMSLTSQTFTTDHRNAILSYAGMTATQPFNQNVVTRWLPDLTELVLNSPYRALR